MIDRDELSNRIHDALVHLYDTQYLQEHPLARWLAPIAGAEAPGRVLRRLLLEAIQELKSPPDAPPDSQAACRYQFLYLRYVRGQRIAQIGKGLSITERQVYRRQRDALEAVSAALWQKLQPSLDGSGLARGAPHPPLENSLTPAGGDLQLEVNRIGTVRPRTPTDLAQVLRGAVATVGNLAQADRRPISVAIEPDLPPVTVDRTAIRQAIVGLLVSAIGSCGEGEIRAAVAATATEVRLHVQVPCRSGSVTLKHLDGDSNLTVSRRLVELQGGAFTWQFTGQLLGIIVSLPVARPRTVLIVDDNSDTLQLFTRYLEGHAQRVMTASTGEEALRAIVEPRPDAVILDVMLPSADGWEVLHSLRSRPDTADIPVVVCTVLKQQGLARSLGATEFVLKPVTQGALLAALDRCWYRAR